MIDIGLVLSRLLHYAATTTLFGASLFLHYAATTTLFGASLFPLYVYADAEPEGAGFWRRKLLLLTAVLALVSGLFWFAFSAASMTGSLSDLADAETLWAVVHDTGFGVIWTGRVILAAITIIVLMAVRPLPTTTVRQNVAIPILAAMLLASLAGIGHTQVEERWASLVHMLSDAAHLLAAGAWLGGLVPLAYILAHHTRTSRELLPIDPVLLRFSGMGYAAVATLVGTGLINSWFLIGSVSNLLTTPYGETLLAKLALFAGMLALAVANRFWLVPRMRGVRSIPCSGKSDMPLRRLRNHVLGEQLLEAMILAIVSFLGTMPPAILH
jgi:copper resistance protein D